MSGLGEEVFGLFLLDLRNGKLEILLAQCLDLDVVFILDLVFNLERFVIGRDGRHLHVLHTQLVVDDNRRVRAKLERA